MKNQKIKEKNIIYILRIKNSKKCINIKYLHKLGNNLVESDDFKDSNIINIKKYKEKWPNFLERPCGHNYFQKKIDSSKTGITKILK